MRRFVSYGSPNKKLHYYVPRTDLIDHTYHQLLGDVSEEGGHYITIWGPRQRGKTWILQQVMQRLRTGEEHDWIDVVKLNLQDLKQETDSRLALRHISIQLLRSLGKDRPPAERFQEFAQLFTNDILDRPLVLILDEFDALPEALISGLTGVFRNIYIRRQDEFDKPTTEKSYLLHSVALIGVRSVLGVDNPSGSPFNVQRSMHIPNLTADEVDEIFQWYQQESGQKIEPSVIEHLYNDLGGQPGLTSWFGELLTESYNKTPDQPITQENYRQVYHRALNELPNSNIVNIVSKARQKPYRDTILDFFQTEKKVPFKFDNEHINFLYLNGIVDIEAGEEISYVKFANPFVHRRIFNAFSDDFVYQLGQLYDPFDDLSDTITETTLYIKNLIKRYETYLKHHREELLRYAPQRTDLRYFEAIFHFHLYKYLYDFLSRRRGQVIPEFPTGNGQIDLILHYADQVYGLEVKSFSGQYEYNEARKQAARYANKMNWSTVWLIFFVEKIDETNRQKYEVIYQDPQTNVTVEPIFVETL